MTVFGWILVAIITIMLGACTFAPFILSGRIAEQEEGREAHPCGPGCSGWDSLAGCMLYPCPWRETKDETKDGAA